MLWTIGAILFAVWVVSLLFKVTTGLIHIALVAALLFFVFGFVKGRGGRSTAVP